VSQTVQAQDEVKILLDAYNAGVSQTYLYELLDEKPDPANANAQMRFGLFTNNNTPKLAAVAIHDLTSLLSANHNPVSGFVPGSLAWSATGSPSAASTMLLEKTNGAFDLAIWNEPGSASAGAANISVALGAMYGIVKVFDPITGTAPIATLANVSQVNLSLGADPLIIEVEPAANANAAAQKLGKVAAFSVAPAPATPAVSTAAVCATQLAAITPTGVGAVAPMSFVEASTPAKSASPQVELAASPAAGHAAVLSSAVAPLGFHIVATQKAWHAAPLSVTHTILPAGAQAGHFISSTEKALALSKAGTISSAHEAGFFH
jgi:hypothetical protein